MRNVRRSLLIALTGPMATSADTSVNHAGRYGVHYLADSEEYPGVRCRYDETVVQSLRVRDPLVFARDAHPDRVDSRWVSWKYRVQAETVKGWATVARSELQKRIATDAQVANFSPMRTTFPGSATTQYRVVVTIRWYGANGSTVVGRAVHRADWYAWEGVPSFGGGCPGGIF